MLDLLVLLLFLHLHITAEELQIELFNAITALCKQLFKKEQIVSEIGCLFIQNKCVHAMLPYQDVDDQGQWCS